MCIRFSRDNSAHAELFAMLRRSIVAIENHARTSEGSGAIPTRYKSLLGVESDEEELVSDEAKGVKSQVTRRNRG